MRAIIKLEICTIPKVPQSIITSSNYVFRFFLIIVFFHDNRKKYIEIDNNFLHLAIVLHYNIITRKRILL